jgi:hypothetical protein
VGEIGEATHVVAPDIGERVADRARGAHQLALASLDADFVLGASATWADALVNAI